MQYRFIPHLVGLILIVTILLISGLLYLSNIKEHSQHYRAEVSNRLHITSAKLENQFKLNLSLLDSLASFVGFNHKQFDQSEFEKFVAPLIQNTPAIRSVRLSPTGRIKYVYPRFTHHSNQDYELFSKQELRDSKINQSIRIKGPQKLPQGGKGFIASKAIFFIDSVEQKQTFWGYATIVIDLMPILSRAGLYGNHENLLLALRSFNDETQQYRVFFGPSSIFKVDALIQQLNIPFLSMQLALIPQGGWNDQHGNADAFLVGGLIIAFTVGYFAFMLLRSPIFLREQLNISSTQLERKSDQLKFQQQLHNSLINNIPDLIYYKDIQGRYITCNQAFANYYEKKIDDIIGKTDEELNLGEMGGYFHYISPEFHSGKQQERDEEWVEKISGEFLFLDTLKMSCYNASKQLTGFLGVSRDCTEQRLTEDALKISEVKYSQLIKTLNEIICEIEIPSGKIIHISDAAKKIFNLPLSQMTHIDFIKKFATEASRDLLNSINKKHHRNIITPVYEFQVVVGDKIKTLRHRERGVFNAQGKLLKVEAICNDVSDEKRYEAVLRVMAEGLSSKTGTAFFTSVVEYISSLFNAEHVFIAEIDAENNQANSLVYVLNGDIVGNISYDLKNTPCNELISDGSCYFDNVNKMFPDDVMLHELHVKSYLGVPLLSNNQKVCGLLVVLSKHDIEQPNHALAILELFAIRVSAELQRMENDNHLRKLSRAVEQSPLSVVVTDTQGHVEYANNSFYNISGYTEAEVLGKKTSIIRSGRQDNHFYQELWQTILSGEDWHGQMWNRKKNGEEYLESVSIYPVRNEADKVQNFVAIKEDLTDFYETQKHLQLSDAVYNTTTEAIIITDQENKIISTNPAFSKITGYSAEEVKGKNPSILSSGFHPPEFYQQMNQTLADEGKWEGEIWNRRKNGELYPEWLSIVTINNPNGEIQQYIALFSDITKGKEQDQLIHRQANYDALTGLPNRSLFYTHLVEALKNAQKHSYSIVILFIDLDRFKLINDTLGHSTGDKLLQKASNRIESLLPDASTIARLGDDDFAVIVNEGLSLDKIVETSKTLLKDLSVPYLIDAEECYVSASIGLSIYPDDTGNNQDIDQCAKNLITHAESAMFNAKKEGGNHFQFYTPKINEKLLLNHQLHKELYQALANNEFETFYQPIFNNKEHRFTSAEALIRWKHPSKGLITPFNFIPYAEESGQIIPIGLWLVKDVCRQIQIWETQGQETIRISINLSPIQYLDSDSIEEILKIITDSQINRGNIVFEITENINMEENQSLKETLYRIQEFGISLSMDDFGTGYSSLSYLKRLPISILKIDRSFVKELGMECDTTLVKAIVAMAKSLELEVIAEGVEDIQQLEIINSLGGDYIQGFYYSKPLPAKEFEVFLAKFKQKMVSTKSYIANKQKQENVESIH